MSKKKQKAISYLCKNGKSFLIVIITLWIGHSSNTEWKRSQGHKEVPNFPTQSHINIISASQPVSITTPASFQVQWHNCTLKLTTTYLTGRNIWQESFSWVPLTFHFFVAFLFDALTKNLHISTASKPVTVCQTVQGRNTWWGKAWQPTESVALCLFHVGERAGEAQREPSGQPWHLLYKGFQSNKETWTRPGISLWRSVEGSYGRTLASGQTVRCKVDGLLKGKIVFLQLLSCHEQLVKRMLRLCDYRRNQSWYSLMLTLSIKVAAQSFSKK